jgi:hypothetical protein
MTREYHKLLFDTPAKPPAKDTNTWTTPAPLSSADQGHAAATKREVRYGTGEATIMALGLRGPDGKDTAVVETHTLCEAYFRIVFRAPVADPSAYGFIISNAKGVEVYGTRSGLFRTAIQATPPNSAFECRLRFVVRLVPGRYFLTAAVAHDDERTHGQFLDFRFDAFEFQVMGTTRSFTTSLVDLDAQLSHVSLAH